MTALLRQGTDKLIHPMVVVGGLSGYVVLGARPKAFIGSDKAGGLLSCSDSLPGATSVLVDYGHA